MEQRVQEILVGQITIKNPQRQRANMTKETLETVCPQEAGVLSGKGTQEEEHIEASLRFLSSKLLHCTLRNAVSGEAHPLTADLSWPSSIPLNRHSPGEYCFCLVKQLRHHTSVCLGVSPSSTPASCQRPHWEAAVLGGSSTGLSSQVPAIHGRPRVIKFMAPN